MSDLPPLPATGPEAPRFAAPESVDPAARPDAAATMTCDSGDSQPVPDPSRSRIWRAAASGAREWFPVIAFVGCIAGLIAVVALYEPGGPAPGATTAVDTSSADLLPHVSGEASTQASGEDRDERLPLGSEDPIRFGTPTYIRMGGATTSVWRVVVETPQRIGAGSDSDYQIDVTIRLESADTSGAVEMPALIGGWSDRWRVSWGGLTRPPDQGHCAQESGFVAFPDEIRLREGEQMQGSLCLVAPTFLPLGDIGRFKDHGLVEFATGLGDVTFTNDGRAEDRIDLDGSLAQVDGVGLAFDSPVALDRGSVDGPDIWNVSIGVPKDGDGRLLGDPSFDATGNVLLSFPVVSTLVDSAYGDSSRLFMLSYLIGGQTGTRYDVGIGGASCPDTWDVEIAWAHEGYSSTNLACADVSGADAASTDTVFALSTGIQDLTLFRLSGAEFPSMSLGNVAVPVGAAFGTPVVVDPGYGDFEGEWTIRSAKDAVSADGTWRNVTVEVGVEPPQAAIGIRDYPLKIHVLGGATRQVHAEPCSAADIDSADRVNDPLALPTLCVRVPETDAGHSDTRYVLQVAYDFSVFEPIA